MKDLLLPFAIIPSYMAALTMDNATFWERVAEKWGIGFIGLGLFLALSWWTVKREDAAADARSKRESAVDAERLAMQTEIRDLHREHLEQSRRHAAKLEQIIKDGNKAQSDLGIELKNLARRVKCVAPPQ